MGANCDQCETIIQPGDELVTFGVFVLCSRDCLARIYLDSEHLWKAVDQEAEYVGENYERGTL